MAHSEISPQEMFDLIRNAKLPQQHSYVTRDKSQLFVRHYPANSDMVLILLHGIAEDAKYLFGLAEYVSSNHLAQVYTPDLRGYGEKAERKGDVDYIGQLDHDLADLIHWIKERNPRAKIILGGHSFGGASVLRFSASPDSNQVDAYLFIARYIHPSSPVIRKSDGSGTSKVSISRFILLALLENLRLREFHHWKVLSVNKPVEIQHGGEALNISFRLAMSRMPQNYQKNIDTLTKPSLVLVGQCDEMLDSDKFDSVFKDNPTIISKVLPNHNHDGILFSTETYREIEEWLTNL